jgi:hypothetical protein
MARTNSVYEVLIFVARVLGGLYGLWHGLRFGWRLFKGDKDSSQ